MAERWSRGYRLTSTRDILWDLVRDAGQEIWGHRGRSLLTLSGVVFGCASVVAMASLTVWMKTTAFDELPRMMGRGRSFAVFQGSDKRSSRRAVDRQRRAFTHADLQVLRRVPGVAGVHGENYAEMVVRAPSARLRIWAEGKDAGALEQAGWPLLGGRSFAPLDIETEARVALVGSGLAHDLYGGSDPVGRPLVLDGIRFTVIGVMEPKRFTFSTGGGDRGKRSLWIPYSWLTRYRSGGAGIGSLMVVVAEDADFAGTMQAVRSTLLMRHGAEDFRIRNSFARLQEILTEIGRLLSGWDVVVYTISGVTLLVGGIGLLGVLLISVRERVREIGIRKALGAGEQDIIALFLAESLALSLGGGVVGVAAGSGLIVAVQVLARAFELSFAIPVFLPGVVASLVFSGVVGLVFGWYPAYRASKLNPVEAIFRV